MTYRQQKYDTTRESGRTY